MTAKHKLRGLYNNGPLYGTFVEAIDEDIARASRTLESTKDVAEIHRMQGAIKALRSIKGWRADTEYSERTSK